MKIKNLAAIIVLSIFFTSCKDNSEKGKLLIGNWTATEWLSNGKPSGNDVASTHFSFDDKGHYTYESTGTKQAGTYKLENDMLFSTAEKQQEIMVKITKLTKDSLVFDMNNGGQAETLTLLKK